LDLSTITAPNGVVFLQSKTLAACGGVSHGFSTRFGGVSQGIYASLNLGHTRGDDAAAVRENYRRFLAATGAGDVSNLVISHQVHRDNIRVCTMADAGKGLDRERDYEADGLMTDVPGLPLVIFTADCIPILFYDPVRQVIAASHAGWRGTALGIAFKTVQRMAEVYSCKPNDICAAIGPGISECCFLCCEDVPDVMRKSLGSLAERFIRPAGDGMHFHVDLKGINTALLREAGVEQIDCSSDCTGCLREKYWNHRTTGASRGSMASVIMLNVKK
jgi:YfiH family protein